MVKEDVDKLNGRQIRRVRLECDWCNWKRIVTMLDIEDAIQQHYKSTYGEQILGEKEARHYGHPYIQIQVVSVCG
jgi:hypothetical protein